MRITSSITLTPQSGNLTDLYRKYAGDYPKFFKMDLLSRLGFVATEMALQQEEGAVSSEDIHEHRAVIFANRSASIKNDRDYEATIQPDDYFPSPALFVYTLPNIVTGEIAIRHKYMGESSFYILDDESQLLPLVEAVFQTTDTTSAIVGWVECPNQDDYIAKIQIVWKN